MLGSEFRGLAETVTRAYGEDPWFFLRELAQNSRDAGARNIWVDAEISPSGMETITFADDGRGMSLAHARRFLFRLYASDKGGDVAAAGRYGIGFWTILRFQPSLVLLQSRHAGDSWAVALDAELNVRSSPCRLDRPGMAVSLSRPARFASTEEFAARVEAGLRTYCRYLRRNDRRAGLLPLWFAGKNLTEPMALPGPLSLSFRSGPVEGAVGLGTRPLVRLYARGLPVWQGAVLSQMSHLQADADIRSEVGGGLAPVFLLNGNHLDVTFSRNLAVENRALDLVRGKAEAALHRLLELSLEKAFPRRWHQRLLDRLQASRRRLQRRGWHWLLLIMMILVPLELLVLSRWRPAPAGSGPGWFGPDAAPLTYRGATVSASPAAAELPFSYRPERPSWFRLFIADRYDAKSGFIRGGGGGRLEFPHSAPCQPGNAMDMSLSAGGGEIFLPLAPGHALLPGSLRLDGRNAVPAFRTPLGESVAVVPAGGGMLTYRSCAGESPRPLTTAEISRFTGMPPRLSLPQPLEKVLSGSRSLPAQVRVAQALSLVRDRLAYDMTLSTAERYRRLGAGMDWLDKVLRIGRGDCDVLNGLQVLLLRRTGIPSRLVIGMIGEGGRARPALHAWAEYFDRGWRVSDATLIAGSPVAPASPGPSRGRPRGPARPDDALSLSSVGPILGLLLLAAAAGIFLLRRKRYGGKPQLPPADQMEKPLLQLIQHALLQPQAWKESNPLWRHRLLPVVCGDAISLDRAGRLLRRKKLFFTANLNPLALAMAASGICVLDLSRPQHAPLRTLLEGAIDSDLLCRLRPEPAASGPGLLAAVNEHLGGRSGKTPPCLLAPGLQNVDLLLVSLPAPLRRSPFFFPRRFIAVNPQGAALASASALFARNPALAVIRFLRRLHAERLTGDADGPVLLKKAARRLLASAHE